MIFAKITVIEFGAIKAPDPEQFTIKEKCEAYVYFMKLFNRLSAVFVDY